MILDFIILVKPDWEEEVRQFVSELNLDDNEFIQFYCNTVIQSARLYL